MPRQSKGIPGFIEDGFSSSTNCVSLLDRPEVLHRAERRQRHRNQASDGDDAGGSNSFAIETSKRTLIRAKFRNSY